MDTDAAFQRLQRALDSFSADLDRTRAHQSVSREQIASVEYELDQLKRQLAETALAD